MSTVGRKQMLKTGEQHLEGLRDGREIYFDSELVEDVTTHPAFAQSARSMASLYDITSDPANAERFTFHEDGDHHNLIFLRPKSADDLAGRRALHEAWAAATHGLMGRSPDHVAGFITGMATEPSVFDQHDQGFGKNITDYWRYIRDNDLYLVYAVVPPTGSKGGGVPQKPGSAAPLKTQPTALRVIAEDDSGVTVRGVKILSTGHLFADEVLVGNLLPLSPGQEKEAITFALPIATPGLKAFPRKTFAATPGRVVDAPLATRFDESDAVLFFDDVKVPWERVFAHDKLDTSIAIFYDTPGHSLGNAQAHIRLLAKLRVILGLIRRVAEINGIAEIPAVSERISALAVRVAVVEALIRAQEIDPREWPSGYVSQNRQTLYATMAWTCEQYPSFIENVRDLLGSTPFQVPASASVLDDEYAREIFSQFQRVPVDEAVDRYKLIKVLWDFVGSEFASRHLQYETLYAGPRHVTRGRAGHFFDWDTVNTLAERCVRSIDEPISAAVAP
jgi:4-hydroxyphenylacetate 3-monooxygenase